MSKRGKSDYRVIISFLHTLNDMHLIIDGHDEFFMSDEIVDLLNALYVYWGVK